MLLTGGWVVGYKLVGCPPPPILCAQTKEALNPPALADEEIIICTTEERTQVVCATLQASHRLQRCKLPLRLTAQHCFPFPFFFSFPSLFPPGRPLNTCARAAQGLGVTPPTHPLQVAAHAKALGLPYVRFRIILCEGARCKTECMHHNVGGPATKSSWLSGLRRHDGAQRRHRAGGSSADSARCPCVGVTGRWVGANS
jgi:hypothetical protein